MSSPAETTADDRYEDPSERYSYKSPLIEHLRANDGTLEAGRVTDARRREPVLAEAVVHQHDGLVGRERNCRERQDHGQCRRSDVAHAPQCDTAGVRNPDQ